MHIFIDKTRFRHTLDKMHEAAGKDVLNRMTDLKGHHPALNGFNNTAEGLLWLLANFELDDFAAEEFFNIAIFGIPPFSIHKLSRSCLSVIQELVAAGELDAMPLTREYGRIVCNIKHQDNVPIIYIQHQLAVDIRWPVAEARDQYASIILATYYLLVEGFRAEEL